jgi:hypothetical protein
MLLRSLPLLLALVTFPLAGTGCGGAEDDLPDADAGVDAGDDGGDQPEPDDPDAEADIDWNFGEPISAPLETWTYVPIEGARCGNGTDTGVAVNFTDRSKDLVVFMAPGGACWDSLTCFVLRSATHIEDTMQGEVVVDEARALEFVFNRDEESPFRDLNIVYVPYCTGDVHSGTQVMRYRYGDEDREVHHVGGVNIRRLLERLVPTFPDAERVWFSGASAGGFGATYNWWVAQDAFPDARVDVLNDGAAPIDFVAGRFAQMMSAWEPDSPPGCADCRLHLSELLPYYAARYPPPHRYALLTSTQDSVIVGFSGLTTENFEAGVRLLRDGAGPGQKTFYVPGAAHVLLAQNPMPVSPEGVGTLEWIRQFMTDAPEWDHQGD